MQFFSFSAEGAIHNEWGRKQLRSSERAPKVRKMRNVSKLMKVKVKEKKKMKMNSATRKVKDIVGWKNPPRDWGQWARKLSSIHQSTWKNAGIYEAIMSSTYIVKMHDDLILELGSRWCSQTNTFVFPWGDATLTLEDMLVLGGFSASGVSAFSSLDNDVESLKIKEQLELAKKEMQREYRVPQTHWIKKFINGSGNDLEHAAFLSLWLSRFVFPMGSPSTLLVNKHVFPIAARLSRGIKIALGPVVLAMLYRKSTALAKRLRSTQPADQSGDNAGPIDLRAPFHLVQIWAWERFPMLKPAPDCTRSGDNLPRSARWSKVRIPKERDLKSAMDSSGKAFLWCPYGAFAKRAEQDPESFALCIKTSELLGFDSCIERYQPQYVMRQFGLDQDILCDKVDKITTTIDKMTNCSNTNTCGDVKLFAREATFQPTITAFCEKWKKQQRHSTISQVKVESEVKCGPPPGFPPQIEVPSEVDSDSDSDDDSKLRGTSMDAVNGSVHGTREDEGEVADAKHDERHGIEGEFELATSCDAESYTNERSKDSGLELEARISRLEDIVYAHIKALEAAR